MTGEVRRWRRQKSHVPAVGKAFGDHYAAARDVVLVFVRRLQTEQAPLAVSATEIDDLREEPLQAKPLPEDVHVWAELDRSEIGQFGDAVDGGGVELRGGVKREGFGFGEGEQRRQDSAVWRKSEWRV